MTRKVRLGFVAGLFATFVMNGAALADGLEVTTEYRFGDELVKGDLLRPDLEVIESRGKAARSSLVDVRASFVPELLKTVEDL